MGSQYLSSCTQDWESSSLSGPNETASPSLDSLSNGHSLGDPVTFAGKRTNSIAIKKLPPDQLASKTTNLATPSAQLLGPPSLLGPNTNSEAEIIHPTELHIAFSDMSSLASGPQATRKSTRIKTIPAKLRDYDCNTAWAS